jgi:hypothetical protein
LAEGSGGHGKQLAQNCTLYPGKSAICSFAPNLRRGARPRTCVRGYHGVFSS